ncbi:hypothetical protein Tco_0707138 [Tanacetum coccineum]|uniref:Uncharacterized protein n=1 Tax=Tanacetum coccineum TaxID=301880 RepID=A0ABQ4YAA7_9ASTR
MVTHLSPERMIDLGGRQGATGHGILILQYAKIARKHSTVALRPITIPSTTPASIVNAPPEIVYDQATSNCGFSYVLIGHPASGITDSFGSRRHSLSIMNNVEEKGPIAPGKVRIKQKSQENDQNWTNTDTGKEECTKSQKFSTKWSKSQQ